MLPDYIEIYNCKGAKSKEIFKIVFINFKVKSMSKIIKEDLKLEILNTYKKSPISLNSLSKKYNISRSTISKILKQYGCNLYTKQELYNKGMQEDFFEDINTEEKAYFLGLLIADGCIFEYRPKNFMVILSLQEKDSYMIQEFANKIKSNRKIVTDKRDNSKSITITSNKMVKNLCSYGVVPNKTFKTYLPIIRNYLMKDLIRGILDGDGNISYRKRKPDKELSKENIRGQIAFCGSEQLLLDIKKYLCSNLNIIKPTICKEGNIYSLRWNSKKDILEIGNFLYNNSHIYLIRKKEKFEILKDYFKC